mgnify:CR=1 FL=1
MPETTGLRVLAVDDDDAVLRLIEMVLIAAGFRRHPHRSHRQGGGGAGPPMPTWCCSTTTCPTGTGSSCCPASRTIPGQPSVIMITAHGNESLAAAALRLGAEDYLVKDASLAPAAAPGAGAGPPDPRRTRKPSRRRSGIWSMRSGLPRLDSCNVTLHHTINNPLMAASARGRAVAERRRHLHAGTAGVAGDDPLLRLKTIQETLQRVSTLRTRQDRGVRGRRVDDRPLPPHPGCTSSRLGEAVVFLPDEGPGSGS